MKVSKIHHIDNLETGKRDQRNILIENLNLRMKTCLSEDGILYTINHNRRMLDNILIASGASFILSLFFLYLSVYEISGLFLGFFVISEVFGYYIKIRRSINNEDTVNKFDQDGITIYTNSIGRPVFCIIDKQLRENITIYSELIEAWNNCSFFTGEVVSRYYNRVNIFIGGSITALIVCLLYYNAFGFYQAIGFSFVSIVLIFLRNIFTNSAIKSYRENGYIVRGEYEIIEDSDNIVIIDIKANSGVKILPLHMNERIILKKPEDMDEFRINLRQYFKIVFNS